MSDNEVCLICGGRRLEPGEVKEVKISPVPASPPPEIASPRRGMLDKIRSVVQKDDKKKDEEKIKREEKDKKEEKDDKKLEEKKKEEKKKEEKEERKKEEKKTEEKKKDEKDEKKKEDKKAEEKKKEEKKKLDGGKDLSLFGRLRGSKKDEESPTKTSSSGARFSSESKEQENDVMLSPTTRKSLLSKITGGLRLSRSKPDEKVTKTETNQDRKVVMRFYLLSFPDHVCFQKSKKAAQEAGKKQVVQSEPTVTKIAIARREVAPTSNAPPPLPPKPKLPPKKDSGSARTSGQDKPKSDLNSSASSVPLAVSAAPQPPARPARTICTVCKELIRIGDPVVEGREKRH